MMRAIDRENVLRAFEQAGLLDGSTGIIARMILESAREVCLVRCRECKNFREGGEQTCVLGFDYNPGRDDFCSRGKRMEP